MSDFPLELVGAVRVGPVDYTLTYKRLRAKFGECDIPKAQIFVDPTQSKDQERDTVLHEVSHAVMALTGLDKELEGLDGDIEEAVCRRFVTGLLDTLQRNPQLRRLLFGKD